MIAEESSFQPELSNEVEGIVACLVACHGKFGAYISTPEQRESKVSDLRKDIKEIYEDFAGDFVDYGMFWLYQQMASIEKPALDQMPHREAL